MFYSRNGLNTITTLSEFEGQRFDRDIPASGYQKDTLKENDSVLAINTTDVLICDPATMTFKKI